MFENGTYVRNATSGVDDNGFRFVNEPFFLGAKSATEDHFGGHIFEVIAYTNVLSTTDRESVESYLNYRYFENDRTITASAGTGGNIEPEGSVVTQVNESIEFQITPKWEYHISELLIDGSPVSLDGINPKIYSYTWDPVLDDGTISATFAQDEQTLSVTNNLGFHLTSTIGLLNSGSNEAATGDYVQVWQDQSGNGHNFEPTSDDRRPLLEGNASPNGKQGLLFDGNSDTVRHLITMTIDSFIIAFAPTGTISSATPAATFLMNGETINDESLQIGQFTGTYPDELFGLRSLPSSGAGIQAACRDNTGVIDGFNIISLVHDSVNNKWELYLNGDNSKSSSGTDDNGFALTSTYIYLGSSVDFTYFFGGDMFEVLAYTNSLSDADRESVESYLKFKFTSPEPPPSGTMILIK